jgi:ribonuclease HI
VDKSLAWGFFDGSCQGPYSISGIGFLLYFIETHKVQVKYNIGIGTNNQGELKALYY